MSAPWQHFIKFGNGTTALWAALSALGCRETLVAVPSTICPSVICAIFASGNRPYFVDIELNRFGMNESLLPDVLPHVGAVIAVHAMGIPCNIYEIASSCQKAGIPLIEDCCQAQGAEFDGKAVGQFGDVAIFSYGAGKIIDAGGGGALETRTAGIAKKAQAIADSLPMVDMQSVEELGLFYKFFYNHLYPSRLGNYQSVFTDLVQQIGPKLLGRYPDCLDRTINDGLHRLADNVQSRRQKAALYERVLTGQQGLEVLHIPEGSVTWRFNVHLDFPARQFILKRMLAEGRAISSWSPNISEFMDRQSYESTPLNNSKWLGDGILNLWVNDEMDDRLIAESCNHVLTLLAEYQGSCG
jgi:dTDP-4-amino-4,6-dideoxygalactose transaminase